MRRQETVQLALEKRQSGASGSPSSTACAPPAAYARKCPTCVVEGRGDEEVRGGEARTRDLLGAAQVRVSSCARCLSIHVGLRNPPRRCGPTARRRRIRCSTRRAAGREATRRGARWWTAREYSRVAGCARAKRRARRWTKSERTSRGRTTTTPFANNDFWELDHSA